MPVVAGTVPPAKYSFEDQLLANIGWVVIATALVMLRILPVEDKVNLLRVQEAVLARILPTPKKVRE